MSLLHRCSKLRLELQSVPEATQNITATESCIAVAPYTVIGRSKAEFCFFIAQAESDGVSTTHALSVKHFFDIGLSLLKEKVAVADVTQSVLYYFNHRGLDRACYTPGAWRLLSKVVGAGALPASTASWLQPSSCRAAEVKVLDAWKRAGFLEEFGCARWRVTVTGQAVLMCCRQAIGARSLFKRRSLDTHLMRYTVWELLDLLLRRGWTPSSPQRKREPVIFTKDGCAPSTFYYTPKGMKVDRGYLLCLACVSRLGALGLQVLGHGQLVQYYQGLLNCMEEAEKGGDGSDGSLVDDRQFFHSMVAAEHDDASDHVELGDGSDTASLATDVDVPPLPDQPDQGSLLADVNSIDSVATTMATTAGTFKWGPFSFTNVNRSIIKNGRAVLVMQVQCICPFRREAGDPLGTQCSRTTTVTPEHCVQTMLQLKSWCLQGRS